MRERCAAVTADGNGKKKKLLLGGGCLGCLGLVCCLGTASVAATSTDAGRLRSKSFQCVTLDDARECVGAAMIHDNRGELAQAEPYYRRGCELGDAGSCQGLSGLATEHHLQGNHEEALRLAREACTQRVDTACAQAVRYADEP